jgi:mRNA interferase MazF
MPRFTTPRRGDIWMIDLDPAFGHEIQKTRPCVVVTNDHYNANNWVVLVVPLTSQTTARYDQVLVLPPEGGLRKPSVTLPDQLTAIDRSRMRRRLGRLTPSKILAIDESLRLVLDLF